jgi:hypothetical protein
MFGRFYFEADGMFDSSPDEVYFAAVGNAPIMELPAGIMKRHGCT